MSRTCEEGDDSAQVLHPPVRIEEGRSRHRVRKEVREVRSEGVMGLGGFGCSELFVRGRARLVARHGRPAVRECSPELSAVLQSTAGLCFAIRWNRGYSGTIEFVRIGTCGAHSRRRERYWNWRNTPFLLEQGCRFRGSMDECLIPGICSDRQGGVRRIGFGAYPMRALHAAKSGQE